MQATLASVASRLQTVFLSLPDQAADQANLIQRKRKFTPFAFAAGLVLAWMQHPNATYPQLLAFLACNGVSVCPSALCQRFTPALADFFLRLLTQAVRLALQPRSAELPLLSRFTSVFIHDSTVLPLPPALAWLWPGCGGDGHSAALKISVCLELLGNALKLSLEPGKQADSDSPLLEPTPPKGALVINDLGYFNLSRLAAWAAAGVFWITRASAKVNVTARGAYLPLWRYLQQQADCVRLEQWLPVGEWGLNCRLIAIRCPQEVASRRRQKLYEKANKRGEPPGAAALALCDWTVFLTNVPPEKLSWREVWVVYRMRWQVELLFKRWKSLGGLSQSRGEKEYRLVVEVYAKLLGALLRQWLLMSAGQGWRLGCSLHKMEMVIQGWGLVLARSIGSFNELVRLLADLAEVLRNTPGVDRKTKKPAAFQTLEDPNNDGLFSSG